MSAIAPRPHGTLTSTLIQELTRRIERQIYRAGDRMPSEQQLCKEFGVSRTVVREAVASIRLSGRLASKPGVGVFVVAPEEAAISIGQGLGADSRAALHIMELRIGLEVEAAGLAAERRTPQDLADIVHAFDTFNNVGSDSKAAVEADYAFHLAIARASNNPHFAHLLESAIKDVTQDLKLKRMGKSPKELAVYEKRTAREHGVIMTAIMRGDPAAARNAMYRHLNDSVNRYRRLINQLA